MLPRGVCVCGGRRGLGQRSHRWGEPERRSCRILFVLSCRVLEPRGLEADGNMRTRRGPVWSSQLQRGAQCKGPEPRCFVCLVAAVQPSRVFPLLVPSCSPSCPSFLLLLSSFLSTHISRSHPRSTSPPLSRSRAPLYSSSSPPYPPSHHPHSFTSPISRIYPPLFAHSVASSSTSSTTDTSLSNYALTNINAHDEALHPPYASPPRPRPRRWPRRPPPRLPHQDCRGLR